MKKILKSRLFIFILSVVMSAGITSVFAYSIFANDIGFTPEDNTWRKSDNSNIENVSDALDNLRSRTSNMTFKELYSYSPGSPASFSYTISSNTKNVLVMLSSIWDASIGEVDSTINIPNDYTALYDLVTAESFGSGKTGYVHARVYFIKNAIGTISGTISYRGSIKILEIN